VCVFVSGCVCVCVCVRHRRRERRRGELASSLLRERDEGRARTGVDDMQDTDGRFVLLCVYTHKHTHT
jgi:hypothetical protein